MPIVDINEPIISADVLSKADPKGQFDDPDLLPLWTLSPAEKARRKAERERILDLLEEEERLQEQRDTETARERHKEEMERRKEAAQKEIENLKKARELQKRMGKALMRSVVESREREEKDQAEQLEKDRLAAESRVPKKKSVSFADDIDENGRIKSESSKSGGWGDVAPGTLRPKGPMKMHVVERHPRSLAQAGFAPEPDSDDESDPGSVPSDGSENDLYAHGSESGDAAQASDEDESQADEEISDWNGEDFDSAQHQREIALKYYEKRRDFGAETSRAMRAHTHEEDEWDQPVSADLGSPTCSYLTST